LHDLAADEQIREVRSRVLAATGRPDVPPDEPVDGIELLDLYRDGRLAKLTGKAQTALAELEDAFDAAADIGLFEAVHQLAAGSFERATAILDTLATGTRTPPELLAPRTPRAGLAVEHRVVVLLEPAAPGPERGWAAGIRGPLASALEAWVGSLLPPADAVGFSALPADGGPATALTLADLELSALDALWLAGDDPGTVPPPLRTLAAGAAGQAEFDPAAAGGAPVSLREFTVLAAALRRAIDALRPADARDLRTAHTRGEPDADDSAALDAASSLIVTFDSQVDRLSDALETGQPATVAPVVEWLARAGLGTGAAPDDLAAAQQLYTLALRRLDRVGQARQGIADHGEQLRRQLAALLGARVPLLATFPFAAAEGGDVVTFAQELAGPDEVDDWLDAAGRVRPDVARLTTAGMLSELLTADGGLRGHAGQSPFLPGDGWAATGLPAADGAGRLSVLALTGPDGPPAPGSPACGLVVDRWSERIPRPEQVTAMALQFDAPSNRPPQSWLLAVTPDGESWNLQLVLDTLLESLEWATLRSVGPEDLLDYGRAVPAVFVPGDLRPWPGGG
jgi:hypothetical protein